MRTKIHLATVFLTGLCLGSISYTLVKNSYQSNNSKIIAEQNSQANLERYHKLIEKRENRYIYPDRTEKYTPELHVISIERGFKITGDKSNRDRASLTVDRPGKKVILFLSAYYPVNWQIKVTEGTEISEIIFGGNREQNVTGISSNIPLKKADYGAYGSRYFKAPRSIHANNFPSFVRQLYQNTGLEISSFQTAKLANFDRPFEIDDVEKEGVFSLDYPQIAHPCSLPKITFQGLYRIDGLTSFGNYSLDRGPDLNNLVPLNNIFQITYSPTNNKYYGIESGRNLVEIDLNTKQTRQIAIPNYNNKRSYLNGITFDTKRNRLLIYDRSNRGSLYAYSLNTRQWNKINLNVNGFTSIVYHPEDDSIYAVRANSNQNRDRNYLTLYKFNSNGAVIDILNFSDPALIGVPNSYNSYGLQLISSGQDLVMVWGNKRSNSQSYNISAIEPRIYLIDLETRKVKLTWKEAIKVQKLDR